MSEKINKLKLYVVQPNETIDTICQKMNVSKEYILRLNPILKVSILHAGQPLNIPLNTRDSNEESFELDCPTLFIKHAYLIKQLLLSKIYIPNYVYSANKPLHDSNSQLIKCIEYHMSLPNAYNFTQIIEEFQNNILDFIDVVNKKDQNTLAYHKNTTKDLMNSYSQLQMGKANTQNIDSIMKNWQLYIIKMMSNQTDEAENIFNQIEKQYVEISKAF
ncbi:MAG: LysM peptidoglycan-binding domain-containing protein [Erysipelotrichales bacterium]|nr:LysM peptidoglycan-binding domain-containing protein [Erysipelotrichales bacterium]